MEEDAAIADDAALAAVALALAVAAGFAVSVDVSTTLFLAAALLAVVLEVLLSSRAEAVRGLWTRRGVRSGALALVVLVSLVGAMLAPRVVFSVLWGGLSGYLALAALVLAGYLPPSTEWFGS
ncbi:hypothetical protein [Haloarchaeobius amylolyticus]|uniref:hypothetical protein n=1 Tax=Haloarchaeobius amylolyticus TaxID=1198296 RepID=UPI00226E4D2B|nr:hypothetical protein [Haloarchaeobius amylolyticus]